MWKERLNAETLRQKAAELRQRGFKPGCDDMTAKSAELWIAINGDSLLKNLYDGSYVPMPAMGFRTAKVDGSYRTLTRLTAIDMIIQRAFLDALPEECENRFSDFSLRNNDLPGRMRQNAATPGPLHIHVDAVHTGIGSWQTSAYPKPPRVRKLFPGVIIAKNTGEKETAGETGASLESLAEFNL